MYSRKTFSVVVTFFTVLTFSVFFSNCSSNKEKIRKPRDTYMPDMYVSRALGTYENLDYLHAKGINFYAKPVEGTISREESLPYLVPNSPEGEIESNSIINPLPELDEDQMKEAERKYLIYCGICHGTNLEGNGPLYKGGEGPYAAKPATLVGDPQYESLTPGSIFYTITYGKNLMGAYASQLSEKERWMIVHYIKNKQNKK